MKLDGEQTLEIPAVLIVVITNNTKVMLTSC